MLVSDWLRNAGQSLVAAHRRGEGNIGSLHLPDTMRRAFERQYHGLTTVAERMLHLMAVAGRRVSITEVHSLLGIAKPAANLAALELFDRGLVRLEDGRLGFTNELHRSYVYAAMPEESRKFYHGQMGEALATGCCAGDFQRLFESSQHFLRGGSTTAAADSLVGGAELALERGAPKEAEQALRRVGPLCRDRNTARITTLLAEALLAQGHHSRALAAADKASAFARSPAEVARVAAISAEAILFGRLRDRAGIGLAVRSALSEATKGNDEQCLARALLLSAEVAYDQVDSDSLNSVARAAANIVKEAKNPFVYSSAQITLAYCALVTGRSRAAARLFSSAAGSLRALSRESDLRRALNGLGIVLTSLGDWEHAVSCFREAIRLAENAGDFHTQSVLWDNLAVLYEDTGSFHDAVKARRTAFQLSQGSTSPKRLVELFTNSASLSITLGAFSEAALCLEQAERFSKQAQLHRLTVSILLARADLGIAQHQDDSAWENIETAIAVAGEHGENARGIADFERARRHFIWATQGFDTFVACVDDRQASRLDLRISQRLELKALEEWVFQREGKPLRRESVVNELRQRGIYGAIAHLVALHIYPGKLPTRRADESSVRLVKRAFPEHDQRLAPRRVGVPL
jgi:tetratricopeptide (TPR) repeat protein